MFIKKVSSQNESRVCIFDTENCLQVVEYLGIFDVGFLKNISGSFDRDSAY